MSEIADNFINTISDIDLTDDKSAMAAFSTILAMPDEAFEVLKNPLMDSFEKTFNTPAALLSFSQIMNINAIKPEDFMDGFEEIVRIFEETLQTKLSDTKIDFVKQILSIIANAVESSEGVSKRIITIPIELCNENAKLPTYATDGSAAMDVYSPEEYVIHPGETKLIHLGFKVNIPRGYALLVHPRSGMSLKTKIRVANSVGVVDSDFHQEVCLIAENIAPHLIRSDLKEDGTIYNPLYGADAVIGKGERCCQLRLVEVPMINWLQVESLGDFENDHGAGFGSTGKF